MATTMHVSDVAELLSEGRTHFNLSPALLVEHSIRRDEAKMANRLVRPVEYVTSAVQPDPRAPEAGQGDPRT